ncbi:MAG: pyridoxal phosphate-dependent aminotransferase [Myxococcales bacterium]|nr:pyridoxal phosphate-dependent aminotransferase [Myxococcales bacterium]
MFPPTRYLQWAYRLFGNVRYDLATSGVATVPAEELGGPPLAALDDPAGHARAREAIARYNDVGPDQVIAALGTTHAIWLAYVALTSPGDDILVEDPAYEPLVRIAEGIGARVSRFVREPDRGFALDPDRIGASLSPRTKLVVISNLHNPSGVRAPDDALREAARVAASRGAHLLVDEVYAPFDELVDDRGVFQGSARRLAPNVVVASSLTKCYGLAPARLGWLLGPPGVVAQADHATVASIGTLPLAHAHALAHALARVGVLAARARLLVAGKRERVAAWIARQRLDWSDPREGLFGFVTLPRAGDLTPAIEAMAREQEVLVAAGSFFGIPNGFRLAWTAPADALDEGLERLRRGLAAT